MNKEDIINEHGIELVIEQLALLISEKMDEFKKTRDKNVERELSILLVDRDKVYNNDKETIEKYLNMGRK